jgi:hypothetical protein
MVFESYTIQLPKISQHQTEQRIINIPDANVLSRDVAQLYARAQ